MGNKKNIDKLFQEQFKDFNQVPNEKIWEDIQQNLYSEEKKKRSLPFWMVFSGIAATITILIVIGTTQFSSEKTIPDVIVNTADTPKSELQKNKQNNNSHLFIKNTDNTVSLKENQIDTNLVSTTSDNASVPLITRKEALIKFERTNENTQRIAHHNNVTSKGTSSEKKKTITQYFISHNNTISSNPSENSQNNKNITSVNHTNKESVLTFTNEFDVNGVSKNSTSNTSAKNDAKTTSNEHNPFTKNIENTTNSDNTTKEGVAENKSIEEGKETITEAIVAQNTVKENDKKEEDIVVQVHRKWDVSTAIAPVYYNTLTNGSPIDNQFNNNTKKGQINTSYGVNVTYALNKKFSIRTGIHKLELGYDTQDVAVFPVSNTTGSGGSIGLKGLDAAPGVNLNISNANSFSVSQIPQGFSLLFDSSLNQRLGYIEVPLEVGYQISNKKMKINILAGMSTFILNKNEIYTETNEVQTYLGSGNNLNKTSFSTNIGIGFNYTLSKHLNFNVEPVFKYQVNAFTKDAGSFKPYILGVYTGFSFKF